MRLKAYHITLLITLFLAAFLDIALLGLTIYHFVMKGSRIDDGIIYCLCFGLLLAFNILEIVNTILSFKQGSRFVKYLCYDDANVMVNGVFVIAFIFAILSFAVLIYCLLIISGCQILFADLDRPMIYVTLSFATLILFNALALLLFPLLGKDDKSFQIKRKKKRGQDLL